MENIGAIPRSSKIMLLTFLILTSVWNCRAALDWVQCPQGQSGNDCAYLKLPLAPLDPSLGEVTAFIRRFYTLSPTDKAIFMIAGGPGDSAESFSGGASYFISQDPTATVYLIDQRGVGLSSGVTCKPSPAFAFNPNNATIVESYKACNADVIDMTACYFLYCVTRF